MTATIVCFERFKRRMGAGAPIAFVPFQINQRNRFQCPYFE